MRLICPSCGAQYEVDESVIPDGGRDVQCSNCGHAWFQLSAKQLKAEAEQAARKAAADEGRATGAAEAPSPAAADEAPPEPSGAWAERIGDEPTGEPDVPTGQPQTPERPRRTLDDAVRNVLREEAERETRARIAEGSAVETQPSPLRTAPPERVVRTMISTRTRWFRARPGANFCRISRKSTPPSAPLRKGAARRPRSTRPRLSRGGAAVSAWASAPRYLSRQSCWVSTSWHRCWPGTCPRSSPPFPPMSRQSIRVGSGLMRGCGH